jgi:hypothetical protein
LLHACAAFNSFVAPHAPAENEFHRRPLQSPERRFKWTWWL